LFAQLADLVALGVAPRLQLLGLRDRRPPPRVEIPERFEVQVEAACPQRKLPHGMGLIGPDSKHVY